MKSQVTINRNIGGSRLVAFIGPFSPATHTYIDIRTDKRPDRCEVAEVVRNGHVIETLPLHRYNAPDVIVGLIRYYTKH